MYNGRIIPQMEPWFDDQETMEIDDYLKEAGWMTEFKRTSRFEEMICQYTGAKHCIVVNNGTISLTLAAIACGLQAGDEVIIPNYTMIATPNSVQMIGCKPVFVDVELETLCLNSDIIGKAITSKTKAVMLVSANGRFPVEGIEKIVDLCKEHNLVLIEDAAQSLGSFYPSGVHIGLAGKVGSISFSAPKIISTGQGGALITNDDELNTKLRKLKDFGRSSGGNDIHETIGYNFKFTELQACLGIVQMRKLPGRVERKKQIFLRYEENLSGCRGIQLFKHKLDLATPWFIDSMVEQREELISFLGTQGIRTRTMYPPINKQLAYNIEGEHAVSNLIGQKGLWLPSATQLSDDEIDYICGKIKSFYVC